MKIMTRQTSFEDEREANVKLCPGLKLKPLKLAIFQLANVKIGTWYLEFSSDQKEELSNVGAPGDGKCCSQPIIIIIMIIITR